MGEEDDLGCGLLLRRRRQDVVELLEQEASSRDQRRRDGPPTPRARYPTRRISQEDGLSDSVELISVGRDLIAVSL
jgi:hypothetical protein